MLGGGETAWTKRKSPVMELMLVGEKDNKLSESYVLDTDSIKEKVKLGGGTWVWGSSIHEGNTATVPVRWLQAPKCSRASGMVMALPSHLAHTLFSSLPPQQASLLATPGTITQGPPTPT